MLWDIYVILQFQAESQHASEDRRAQELFE